MCGGYDAATRSKVLQCWDNRRAVDWQLMMNERLTGSVCGPKFNAGFPQFIPKIFPGLFHDLQGSFSKDHFPWSRKGAVKPSWWYMATEYYRPLLKIRGVRILGFEIRCRWLEADGNFRFDGFGECSEWCWEDVNRLPAQPGKSWKSRGIPPI